MAFRLEGEQTARGMLVRLDARRTFAAVVCAIRSSLVSRALLPQILRNTDAPVSQEILHALFD
jgi:hypothetical protein